MTDIRTINDFNKSLEAAEHKVVVLDFYATWCNQCKDMEDLVKSMERQYDRTAVVIKINVDRFDELVKQYKVRHKPTFVFLKDNRNMGRVVGADKYKLTHKMAKLCK